MAAHEGAAGAAAARRHGVGGRSVGRGRVDRLPEEGERAVRRGQPAVREAGAGVAFYFAGRSQMDQFNSDFTVSCPAGCKMDFSDKPFLRDEKDSAELKGNIGVGMMAAGGAVAVTGIILTLANKAQRVMPSVEAQPTPGGATASVGWRW